MGGWTALAFAFSTDLLCDERVPPAELIRQPSLFSRLRSLIADEVRPAPSAIKPTPKPAAREWPFRHSGLLVSPPRLVSSDRRTCKGFAYDVLTHLLDG